MKKCSITACRAINDKRGDGRNGRYSYYAHVVKSLYAYQFLMWFEYFPKSSFFIFTIEQYRKNPGIPFCVYVISNGEVLTSKKRSTKEDEAYVPYIHSLLQTLTHNHHLH